MLAARREVKINSIINTIFNLIFLFPLPVLCKTFSDLPRFFFYLIIQLTLESVQELTNLWQKNVKLFCDGLKELGTLYNKSNLIISRLFHLCETYLSLGNNWYATHGRWSIQSSLDIHMAISLAHLGFFCAPVSLLSFLQWALPPNGQDIRGI